MSTGSTANSEVLFEGADEKPAKKSRAKASATTLPDSSLPAHLGKPIPVKVPDFSNPKRPKTCLEVDFPIVPINALSALEGNAGKPIYQMSKWWARRRSCVFRSLLLAAAIEAPHQRHPDGSSVVDAEGIPVPDETEAAKAVWDVYYANHQQAGNFKHLKVLDCFMGGGTTLVEGSRLGFQVAGVDLNPVAWFVVRNELANPDPAEVQKLLDAVEAEVRPQIQPFYTTDCPRGHTGRWLDVATNEPVELDPLTLAPDERKKYRYEGPEVIYTFWAKHGQCMKPGCDHRTPIFRTPVIAEKVLGMKYLELTCKSCKMAFHAELGDARIAPAADLVVLPSEAPYRALSQPFSQRLLEYGEGDKEAKFARIRELLDSVDDEPGLRCPTCGAFAGQYVRDVLLMHKRATRIADIDKKHLRILPVRNGTKPVYCYLLMHPDWLAGSPGVVDGVERGGFIDAPVDQTVAWFKDRLTGLKMTEVRGRIRLSEDVSSPPTSSATQAEGAQREGDVVRTDADSDEDPKLFGLPRFLTLVDGRQVDTRAGTVPAKSAFTCAKCGKKNDFLDATKYANAAYRDGGASRERNECPSCVATESNYHPPASFPYAVQAHCPACEAERRPYSGRFFASFGPAERDRLLASEHEWNTRSVGDLKEFWPRQAIPHALETHVRKPLACWGYTHFWKMFLPRQLLSHALIAKTISSSGNSTLEARLQALGAFQQFLRNHNAFCIWDMTYDKLVPFFSNLNYHPKQTFVEGNVYSHLGRGNFTSCVEGVVEGIAWAANPTDVLIKSGSASGFAVQVGDRVLPGAKIHRGSTTELDALFPQRSLDLVITDPPFGYNIAYADMADFFYVWLRTNLKEVYPESFLPPLTPKAAEVITNVARDPDTRTDEERSQRALHPADDFYQRALTACWRQCYLALNDGGILAFTFHHAADDPWIQVLNSLFDAGFYLEVAFPVRGDETKGEGSKPGTFGSQKIEYDIIHVCRKRLEEPTRVSWPKMRQWVRGELLRMRSLLESYKARDLSDADIQVILRGKALEFYSRHYGQVYTAEDVPLSIRHALLGINQLLDEGTGGGIERPPSVVQPLAYQFLRLFGGKTRLGRDEVSKSLRGTGIVQREFESVGWVRAEDKVIHVVPIRERFDTSRLRPRREMKTEIDQAHFLIGAAMHGSGISIEQELSRDTWMVRRSVEAVLLWYAKTSAEPEVSEAAELAAKLLKTSLETNRAKLVHEQGYLFDDLEDEAA